MGATLCPRSLNYEQLMSRLMETLTAMSEQVWTVQRYRDFDGYYQSFKKVPHIAAALVQER